MISQLTNPTPPSTALGSEAIFVHELVRILSAPVRADLGCRQAEAHIRSKEREILRRETHAQTQHLVTYMREVAQEIEAGLQQPQAKAEDQVVERGSILETCTSNTEPGSVWSDRVMTLVSLFSAGPRK